MQLSTIDWVIIVLYLCLTMAIGLYFSRKGTKNIQEFFVSGRNLPWWLAGTTMIASAFAIDTPIGVTGLIADNGISGMWYAWSFVMGGAGMLGAFIFSAMLRRSEILSPAEIVDLRYDGKATPFLRGFKGIYFGILANAVTLGWIIKAVWTISEVVFPDVDTRLILTVILIMTLIYTASSGLWGIAATDFIQFIVGSAGSFILAYFTWKHIGGIDNVVQGFISRYGYTDAVQRLKFFPTIGKPFFLTFIVFVSLKWWGNPPPAILQRIIASKNEQHASGATFLFALVAFAFNYWPMIFVAMVSLVMFPNLASPETGYAMVITKVLPSGFLGIMLASLTAAFMSTVDTHLNYGASFMVNDLYKRFFVKSASDKHYVYAAQVSTVIMLACAVVVAIFLDSVNQAWYFMAMLTAGYGIVMVVRWFWWRVNAWSEVTALSVSFVGSIFLSPKIATLLGYGNFVNSIPWTVRWIITVSFCTISWVTVAFLTKPTSKEQLGAFCKKIKPFPLLWGPIVKEYPDIKWNTDIKGSVLRWGLGTIAVFSFCFAMGDFMFLKFLQGISLLLMSLIAGLGIIFSIKQSAIR